MLLLLLLLLILLLLLLMMFICPHLELRVHGARAVQDVGCHLFPCSTTAWRAYVVVAAIVVAAVVVIAVEQQ